MLFSPLMAKKKIPQKPGSPPSKQASPPAKPAALKPQEWYKNPMQLSLVLAVLLAVIVCFSPLLRKDKEFINFDDPVYITHQDLITKLDAKHLKTIFAEHDASLNYHPLTMLSLAINYSFSKLSPYSYFLTNLLIHVLNTLLVFVFLYRLSGKKFWTGVIAAALFGIHPMHVESVAWAAERKDVLYCFFFLASCITYIYYSETLKLKYLVFCFVLFVMSCLSKAMATPLPVVLLLIDFYRQRKYSIKLITEKIPFFIVSLILGYIAVTVQSKGAISDTHLVPLPLRFLYASYGFMMYWVKLVAPISLSAFYPYPLLQNGSVPLIYKLAPAIVALMVAVPLFVSYKMSKEKFRLWAFGIGFFILMVALVLQLLSVGAAIMADRYSYLPYIGLFFIIASYANDLIENKKLRVIAVGAFTVILILLGTMCYARVLIWQNDLILWTNVIDQYPPVVKSQGSVIEYALPEGISIAYDNRANYYRVNNEMDKAFEDYLTLAHYQSAGDGVYNNLGNIYSMRAQEDATKGKRDSALMKYAQAIEMYSKAISMKPMNRDAINNRAICYSTLGDHTKALEDFKVALSLDPANPTIISGLASEEVQLGEYKQGIDDYTKAIAIAPDNPMLLFYRGTTYVNIGSYNEGIKDLTDAVKLNPALAECWYNLSYAYNKINNKKQALDAALIAKKNGFQVADQYIAGLQAAIK